jgi:hypothetical protein
MKVLHKLKRALRRFNRAAEDVALASSVVEGGGPAPQVNAMGVKASLGEIEKAERETTE